MSATFIEVAKFIADKLVIGLIVLGATIWGNFLLEKYKMTSSISISDSNEFVKRLELLWAKAYEVEAEADTLTSLYEDMVVLEKSNMGYSASRAGTNSSFTRCCISWRSRGSGCTGYQI